jgi:hypothetical protein
MLTATVCVNEFAFHRRTAKTAAFGEIEVQWIERKTFETSAGESGVTSEESPPTRRRAE